MVTVFRSSNLEAEQGRLIGNLAVAGSKPALPVSVDAMSLYPLCSLSEGFVSVAGLPTESMVLK